MADLASISKSIGDGPPWLLPVVVGGAIGGIVLLVRSRGGGGATATAPAAAAAPVATPAPTREGFGEYTPNVDQGAIVDQAVTQAGAATAAEIARLQALLEARLASSEGSVLDRFGKVGTGLEEIIGKQAQAGTSITALQAQIAALQEQLNRPVVQPVTPVTPAPQPYPAVQAGQWTGAQWKQYAAEVGVLADLKRQGRNLPAGTQLMLYAGNVRLAAPVINLPKAYTPSQDTKGFEFLGRPQENLLVRAARKAADELEYNPGLDPQGLMLKHLRQESRASGGWQGTGFQAGPTDIAAGYP